MTAAARPVADGSRQEPAGSRTVLDAALSRIGEARPAAAADPTEARAPVSTFDKDAAASPSRLHRYAIQGLPGRH